MPRRRAFPKVIFIIKEQLFEDFKEVIGDRVSKYVQVEYVFQKLDDLPEGFTVPEGREKPWGTGHAVLAARDHIDAPFVVINADDFYGGEAFKKIGAFLRNVKENGEKAHWAMVGYHLKNTLTETAMWHAAYAWRKTVCWIPSWSARTLKSARTARLTPRTTAQRGTRSMRTRPFP